MNPEDSVNNGEPSAWGKLVSINPNLQNQELIKPVYKIGRLDTNDIFIDDIRISGVHCILKLVDGEIILEDTSSNGTYIDKQKIGKGKSMPIMPGRKFYVLHDSKVANKEETLGFILTLNQAQLNSLKRQRMETKKEEEDLIAATTKTMKPASQDLGGFNEGVKCFLCKDCIYKCVTTVPCLHNFCAPCYSERMERSSNCPECHKEVQEIKKNAFWDNIVKSFLEKNPQYKKTRRECEEMDRKNKIHYNKLVLEKETYKHKEPVESQQESAPAAQALTETEKDNEQAMKRKWVKYYELFHRFTAE